MRAYALLCFFSLAACASDVEAVAVAEVDVADNVPAPDREVPSAAPPERPSALEGWKLPGSTQSLGESCVVPAPDAKGAPPLCNAGGNVAIEMRHSALVREKPPCEMKSLEATTEGFVPDMRSGCVDGDHMILSTHCVMCRSLDAGSAFHARLSALSPAQHAYLADMLRVNKDRPTSAAAWRALIASGKLSAP